MQMEIIKSPFNTRTKGDIGKKNLIRLLEMYTSEKAVKNSDRGMLRKWISFQWVPIKFIHQDVTVI